MANYEAISERADDISPEDDYDDIFFRDDFDISVEDDYEIQKKLIQFVDEKKSRNDIDTNENACRFLFAENLVSYIALEFHGLVYNTRINKDSEFFLNIFFETIRHAARFVRNQINNTNSSSFQIIGNLSKLSKSCYKIFVDAVLSYYSQEGIKTGQFFYFCVYVSELASKCYRPDFEEIFDFAVYAILDAFCAFKGKRYELMDFAEALICKSNQSFDRQNEVEICRINLEKIELVGKSNKPEVINNLRISIKRNESNSQENELEKCGTSSEQLSLLDKYEKSEFIRNFAFPMNTNMEKFIKSIESNVDNSDFSFSSENFCHSFIGKIHDREYKKNSFLTEKKLEDILQEVMSVVDFEASLFSATFIFSKNDSYSESQNYSHSRNTRNKTRSSTDVHFQNIQVQDSCLSKEITSQENEKIEDFSDTPGRSDGKQIVDFFAIYKSEGGIDERNLKVLKGESVLFAEDFVGYITNEFYGISYSVSKFDEIRSLSCNAFNETIKEVLNFIHGKTKTLNRIIFDIIANVKEHNEDCYRKYVCMVLSHYMEDGLNSDAFLYFCEHFSELAAKFYTLERSEMLDFAICSILDAFCLLKDDWCEFNVAIQKVLENFKTETDYRYTDCKIHCVDNFEKEYVNAILDTIKSFSPEINEILLNNFIKLEDVNCALSETFEK